ncbi:MAG: hypothetical protein KF810_07160 [Rhizobiaceae bacterium]|nr:hypothetical protein [Rhizobiaceae bacterium]
MSTYVDMDGQPPWDGVERRLEIPAEGRAVLLRAAGDLRILISYISRREPTKVQEIKQQLDTTVADKVIANDYTAVDEAALWEQLAKLSAAAAPASAESIRESKYYKIVFGKGSDHVESKILKWVRFSAVGLFFTAFILGAYVQITNDALSSLTAARAERDKIIRNDFAGTRILGPGNKSDGKEVSQKDAPVVVPGVTALLENGSQTPSVPAKDPDSGGAAVVAEAAAQSTSAATAEAAAIESGAKPNENVGQDDKNQDVDKSSTNEDINAPDARRRRPPTDASATSASDALQLAKLAALLDLQQEIKASYTLLGPAFWLTGTSATTQEKIYIGNEEYVVYNSTVISIQKSMNKFIVDYFIPMIASFLGVAVYIIRETTIRLESVSLSPMAETAYWPRIILGLIAGLSIGWLTPSFEQIAQLTTPDKTFILTTGVATTVNTLTKTALAFVVGYSIEVLFNILDAIKAALGVREEANRQ